MNITKDLGFDIIDPMPSILEKLLQDEVFAVNWKRWQETKDDRPDWVARRRCYDRRDGLWESVKVHGDVLVGVGEHELGVPDYRCYNFNTGDASSPSLSIKINQVGYLADGVKMAYVGYPYPEPLVLEDKFFQIGGMEFPIHPKGFDPDSGENVYQLDFTDFREEGFWDIRIPSIGFSLPVYIGDPYAKVYAYALNGFKKQRCNDQPVLYFSKAPHLPKELNIKNYQRFDAIGRTTGITSVITEPGGWYDAADYDRNGEHLCCILDMLYAYEFTGREELLEEANFGLRIWYELQNMLGGITGMIEANSHYPKGEGKYAISPATRWDSLRYAAVASKMSEYEPIYLPSAIKAFEYGCDVKNTFEGPIKCAKNRGSGEDYDFEFTEPNLDYLISFAARQLSKHSSYYRQFIKGETEKPFRWPNVIWDMSLWRSYEAGNFHHIIEIADSYVEGTVNNFYKRSFGTVLGWGNGVGANYARTLLLAYLISKQEVYRDAAILNMDYNLGANPMNMCWTTGLGVISPFEWQHIEKPAGITVYGPTGGMYPDLRKYVSNQIPAPLRTWSAHPTRNTPQCEFTIQECNSSLLFSAAILAKGNYKGPIETNQPQCYLP